MRKIKKPKSNEIINPEIYSYFPEVTVIVVTYNQDLNKITKTLDSIIIQEEISFEIIICDDGSETRFENELRNYFSSKGFCCYTLIFHDHNEGTVSNYYSGLIRAKGKYTKLLSPGDYFTERNTLSRWIQFLKEKNSEWSFSDAYYYKIIMGKIEFIKEKAHPQIIYPYKKNELRRCTWNYVALQDIANGAAIIGTTRVQLHYCRVISEKGIHYAEDCLFWLMIFHGIVGCYYPAVTIYYEYGTGVSTSGDPTYTKILLEDVEKLILIMYNDNSITDQQKRMVDALIKNRSNNKIRKLFIKGKLYLWLKYHFFPRLTPIPYEEKQL